VKFGLYTATLKWNTGLMSKIVPMVKITVDRKYVEPINGGPVPVLDKAARVSDTE
jgi:hypothetical protein